MPAILSAAEKLTRLGHPDDARLLIINGDDLGSSCAANAATFAAMEEGVMTAASLMAPCPWALAACSYVRGHPHLDVGVHLTLTSEWVAYRWGPVLGASRCPSLVDRDGFFPHTPEDGLFERAADGDIWAEAEAQIQRVLGWGVDPTKLDGHMGTFYSHPRFLAVYVGLAHKYRLPLRMAPRRVYVERGAVHLYDALPLQGLWTIDAMRFVGLQNPQALQGELVETLRTLQPGITELVLHAALPTEESKSIQPDWAARAEAFRLMHSDPVIRATLDQLGIIRVGWRLLRDAQRAS